MNKRFYVGIDVSKKTLDVAFIAVSNEDRSNPQWKVFDNTDAGLHAMKKWLIGQAVSLDASYAFKF